jgi:rod shape-determining protein MreC
VLAFLLPLFVYMSLYTWNWKTGHLDRMARYTGLEIVGFVLTPGKWVHSKAESLVDSYILLRDVQEENAALRDKLQDLKLKMIRVQSRAKEATRLRELMEFPRPPEWTCQGADIIGSQVGPNSVLRSLIINKGRGDGVAPNTPILTSQGIVGRVKQTSPHFSTVLLITDPNSHIPVRGRESRTNGVLCGQGLHSPLQVKHVPQNAPVQSGETLVTSGLAGLFPQGLPVARIDKIAVSDLSLFKKIQARPLVNFDRLEEVLVVLTPEAQPQPVREPG